MQPSKLPVSQKLSFIDPSDSSLLIRRKCDGLYPYKRPLPHKRSSVYLPEHYYVVLKPVQEVIAFHPYLKIILQ